MNIKTAIQSATGEIELLAARLRMLPAEITAATQARIEGLEVRLGLLQHTATELQAAIDKLIKDTEVAVTKILKHAKVQ
jgi:hypothetical protein